MSRSISPRFTFILLFFLMLLSLSCKPVGKPSQAGITFSDGEMCIQPDPNGESRCTPAMDRIFMLVGAGEQMAVLTFSRDHREVLPWQGGDILFRGDAQLSEFEFHGTNLICRPGEGETRERTEIAIGNGRTPFLFLDGGEVIVGEICRNGQDLFPAFDLYDANEIHITAEKIENEGDQGSMSSDEGENEEEEKKEEEEENRVERNEVKRNAIVNTESADGVNVVILENIDVDDEWVGMTFKIKPPIAPPLLPVLDLAIVRPITPKTAMEGHENRAANEEEEHFIKEAGEFCGEAGSESVCNVLFNFKEQTVQLLQCGATLQVVVDNECRCAINLANACELCISRVFLSDTEAELRISTRAGCRDAVHATCP